MSQSSRIASKLALFRQSQRKRELEELRHSMRLCGSLGEHLSNTQKEHPCPRPSLTEETVLRALHEGAECLYEFTFDLDFDEEDLLLHYCLRIVQRAEGGLNQLLTVLTLGTLAHEY